MIEGSGAGSGSKPLTSGFGSASRRPKTYLSGGSGFGSGGSGFGSGGSGFGYGSATLLFTFQGDGQYL
jgi:hypothetical protein